MFCLFRLLANIYNNGKIRKSMVKIKIDKEKCLGCGSCVSVSPKLFEMKGDKAVVKSSETDEGDSAKEAEAICPTGAISVS